MVDRERRIPRAITMSQWGDTRIPDAAALDHFTGDETFDSKVTVRGDPGHLAAVLDPGTRRLLAGLADNQSFILSGAQIDVAVYGAIEEGQDLRLTREVEALLTLAQRLALTPAEVPQLLAAHSRSDPHPGVRWRNLEVLARRFPAHEATRPALRAALGDQHPEVRLRAAAAFGDEGYDILAAVVRSSRHPASEATHLWWEIDLNNGAAPVGEFLQTPPADEARRARALETLWTRFPPERVLPLVREVLREEAGPLVAKGLDVLAAIGNADDEAAAIRALASDDERVRLAALRTPGQLGTAAAVPHLHALADGKPLAFALRRAVDEAVAAIHTRLHGAAVGQVSLADAGDTAGRVNLAGSDPAGRLSLPSRDEQP